MQTYAPLSYDAVAEQGTARGNTGRDGVKFSSLPRPRQKGQCFHCKELGHQKKRCPKLQKSAKPTAQAPSPPRPRGLQRDPQKGASGEGEGEKVPETAGPSAPPESTPGEKAAEWTMVARRKKKAAARSTGAAKQGAMKPTAAPSGGGSGGVPGKETPSTAPPARQGGKATRKTKHLIPTEGEERRAAGDLGNRPRLYHQGAGRSGGRRGGAGEEPPHSEQESVKIKIRRNTLTHQCECVVLLHREGGGGEQEEDSESACSVGSESLSAPSPDIPAAELLDFLEATIHRRDKVQLALDKWGDFQRLLHSVRSFLRASHANKTSGTFVPESYTTSW
ncbi:UNVERIFIED_CONTAM: hypothetical protein FKN15_065467 [Acipenser sinensis]